MNSYLSHYNEIIMRGENFVAHLDGLGVTPVCRGIPVAHHCPRKTEENSGKTSEFAACFWRLSNISLNFATTSDPFVRKEIVYTFPSYTCSAGPAVRLTHGCIQA
jgi:hypothetical protein